MIERGMFSSRGWALVSCGTAALVVSLASAGPATAQCVAATDTVTCSPDGNPYVDGLRERSVGDLDFVMEPGVRVETSQSDLTAVDIAATGTVTLNATDDARISSSGGENAPGVVVSSGGNATLSLDVVETTGSDSAAIIVRSGGGTSTTTNRLTTQGERSNGVDITARGPVIFSLGEVSVSGAGSVGVRASTAGSISGSVVNLTQFGRAIEVETEGSPVMFGGAGLDLLSSDGDIRLSLGRLINEGAAPGVAATATNGNIDVSLTDRLETAGTALNLTAGGSVSVRGTSDAVIVARDATVGANRAGIAVSSGGSTQVTIGSVETNGDNVRAITVETLGGATVTADDVIATGRLSSGLVVSGAGPVTFTLGQLTASGEGAAGVSVTTTGSIVGNVTNLNLEGNSIATDGGKDTEGNPLPPVVVGGVAAELVATGGDINVTLETLTNNADRAGVLANSSGGGVSINVTGDVRTRGAALDLTATSVTYVTNPADPKGVPIAQPIPGTGNPALRGRASVNVAKEASVTGIDNPAIRTNTTLGTTISNAGKIERSSWPGELVLDLSGGSATITNTGTIIGRIRLTGSADTFNNSGTYAFLDGSNFDNDGDAPPGVIGNTGTDTFNNTGTVKLVNYDLARGQPNANKDVLYGQLNNLEVFNNSGLIDLRTGAAGDEFKMSRTNVNTPNGSIVPQGIYNGTGNATLAVDLEFKDTNGVVDRLNVQHATGETKVVVNVLGSTDPNILVNLPVVYVSDGSNGKFSLAPLQVGDIRYSLRYNPTVNAFALYGSVPDSLIRLTKLPGNAQSLWYRSNDMVSAHLRQERDRRWTDAEPKSRLWFDLSGEVATRHETYNETVNYVPVAGLDLSQRQQTYLGQIGFESSGPENGENGVIFGGTIGYGKTNAKFRSASDRYQIDQFSGGAHVSWQVGSFYLTGSASYAKHSINLSNASSRLLVNKASGTSTGAAVEAGVRIGSDTFFVEPSAGFTYVVTQIDGIALRKGRFAFDQFTGNLGSLGIRVGGRTTWGDREIVYYAGGQAVHEYAGNDYADVAIGGPSVDIPIHPPGTFGKATAGINLMTEGRANLFAEANGYFGASYRGGGGKVGLRIGF